MIGNASLSRDSECFNCVAISMGSAVLRSAQKHLHIALCALTAEILYLNGHDLFNDRSTAGGTLSLALKKIADWSLHPESFPFFKNNSGNLSGVNRISYFEFLNQHWPYAPAMALLKRHRPLSADGGIPDLTLTHGGF
ncbi:hypothetical protein WDW86_19030 [Bdellovibrionota bacterium FG-2]